MNEVVGQRLPIFGMWLSLVERCVRDAKAAGSNPVIPTKKYGSLAQLGERLPYKQDVTGSSPVTPTTF